LRKLERAMKVDMEQLNLKPLGNPSTRLSHSLSQCFNSGNCQRVAWFHRQGSD